MTALTPADMECLPLLEYALPLVAEAHPDGVTDSMALYGAIQDALRASGRSRLPMGAMNRLLRAAGYPRQSMRTPGRQSYVFAGLNLLDEGHRDESFTEGVRARPVARNPRRGSVDAPPAPVDAAPDPMADLDRRISRAFRGDR